MRTNGSSACEACQYVYKLFLNRQRKRSCKRKHNEDADSAITALDVECMVASKGTEEESTNLNKEMLLFEESDSDDLRRITEMIGLSEIIPEEMKLL